ASRIGKDSTAGNSARRDSSPAPKPSNKPANQDDDSNQANPKSNDANGGTQALPNNDEGLPLPKIPVTIRNRVNPSTDANGLPPPDMPDSIRKQCEPEYSNALEQARELLNEAASARRAADSFRSEAEKLSEAAREQRNRAKESSAT